MAAHFKGLVNHYSPHNEPGVTCFLCGLVGHWPPYQQSAEDWAGIGVQAAKGMVLETQAIREALSDSVIVSVDPFLYNIIDEFLLAGAKGDPARREHRRAAAACPASLAYGKVDVEHPLGEFLRNHGVSVKEIGWFRGRNAKPDILSFNYSPDLENFSKEGDFTRNASVPAEQAAREAVGNVRNSLLDSRSYFDLPVYLTETSAGLSDEAKIAYVRALYEMSSNCAARIFRWSESTGGRSIRRFNGIAARKPKSPLPISSIRAGGTTGSILPGPNPTATSGKSKPPPPKPIAT